MLVYLGLHRTCRNKTLGFHGSCFDISQVVRVILINGVPSNSGILDTYFRSLKVIGNFGSGDAFHCLFPELRWEMT